jgi:hypothetical protein
MSAKPGTVFCWLCLLLLATPAAAEIGTMDNVPAATLLLPYFEVDLGNPDGITTLFSINNASASAAVAHVVLWTDFSIPTLDFDVYLTGYDVQTINVRDIFNGVLPRTADSGTDPGDTISPKGGLSQDINFPGSTGPCGSAGTVYANPALSSNLIDHLRRSHTGLSSPVFGGRCAGADYGDSIARGYITVDSVTGCNLSFPSDNFYFTSFADRRNVLWGDSFYVNPGERFAVGGTLVHIEACNMPSVGNGAGLCPFVVGDYTFYGRYNTAAADQREPLDTVFFTRYLEGGPFDGDTDLLVWRDSKSGSPTPFTCGSQPSWFPMAQTDVTAFDEEENPTGLCFQGDNVSPPTGGVDTCFPLEAQRIHVAGNNVIAADMSPPSPFGSLFLDLTHSLAAGDPFPYEGQAWVIAVLSFSRQEKGNNGRSGVIINALRGRCAGPKCK